MTKKGKQDLSFLQKRVNSAFKEECPPPSEYDPRTLAEQFDDKNIPEWNPIKMDPNELFSYSTNKEDHFLCVQNWYKTITGNGHHGKRLWKQLVKAHLIEIEPDYTPLLDTIDLKENEAFREYSPHDLPSYQNQDSIVITIKFKKNVEDEKAQLIQTASEDRIELTKRLAKDLKLSPFQIKIIFSVRDPREKFTALSNKRMDNLNKAFSMINRLANKKYYGFDGREYELERIKSEIFRLVENTIEEFEGRRAARDFSRLLEENERDPF
jgi:hypothetical protein